MNGPGTEALGDMVAVVVSRDGRLPIGADETVAEAGGMVIVVGSGAEAGGGELAAADRVWWLETGTGLQPATLAATLAPMVEQTPLVVMPASPDGRDLAPRLAAELGRPLVARAVSVACRRLDGRPAGSPCVHALVSRLDDRVLLPVDVDGPAVATLIPGSRTVSTAGGPAIVEPLAARSVVTAVHRPDPDVQAVVPPDLHTMDLADATRVVTGGAGLVTGDDDRAAEEVFELLAQMAASLGGAVGATRVATDAGWIGYQRQIGTTGVTIDPELYIAFGVSGAVQHVGGLGTPRHIVSVNTDASAPMTAMADLGLVTDAQALLFELGRRFGLTLPSRGEPEHPKLPTRGPEPEHA